MVLKFGEICVYGKIYIVLHPFGCVHVTLFHPVRSPILADGAFRPGTGGGIFRLCPWWRIRIEGAEKIDRSRPWVIVTNHQSMLDIPLMYVLPTTFKWVSKKEVQKMPVFGWVLWMHGDIPVERGSRGSAREMLERCRPRLSRGTRTKRGEIGRFKDGAFLVGKHAGVGIQPVVIDGTWSLNDGWRLRMPHTFRVKVLDALPAEYVASKEARELAVEMENRMRTAHLQMTGKQQ